MARSRKKQKTVLGLLEYVRTAAEAAVADAAKEHLEQTAGASEDPYGDSWAPLVDGEGDPLEGAEEAYSYEVTPKKVKVKIGTPWVYHHFGAGGSSDSKAAATAMRSRERKREKTGKANKFHAVARPLLPDSNDLPDELVRRIKDKLGKI